MLIRSGLLRVTLRLINHLAASDLFPHCSRAEEAKAWLQCYQTPLEYHTANLNISLWRKKNKGR